MNVAVVGGGVIGCACALELAKRGARVVLLERGAAGAEATTASAGILGAQIAMHDGEGAAHDVSRFARAREGYRAWVEELRAETGTDVGHRVSGALVVARSEAEAAAFAETARRQRAEGLRADVLDGDAARAVEPELSRDVVAALHFPDEAQIDPPALMRALLVALSRAGAQVRTGCMVRALAVEGGRCKGVVVDGETVGADATVLAAGSWSSHVGAVPADVPVVEPARGQMVLLQESPPALRCIVLAGDAYAVPRGDGRVLCGSTVERAGFRKEVTAGGVRAILDGVLAVAPRLAAAPIASMWSGFRPYAAPGEIIGASSLPGLFLATGHFRNGILLAKVTAEAIAGAVLGTHR